MNDHWRRLIYRWFVQYNPLYLVSAALVLGGMILTSRGLAQEQSGSALYPSLAVAAIAEVYAFMLIGGAALLTRIGQRRAAAMLALLTAVYQCDLTLHTETCVQLGRAGIVAAAGWALVFAMKLAALAWAVRVRPSVGAVAIALLGATALTVGPFIVVDLGPEATGAFLAAVVFTIAAAAKTARVASNVDVDATVFARLVTAVWGIFGVLFGLHVVFWGLEHNIAVLPIIAAVALLCVPRVRSEGLAWALTSCTLAVARAEPDLFAFVALLATAALTLRGFARFRVTRAVESGSSPGPYRFGHVQVTPRYETALEPVTAAARARLFAGALLTFYLALWTVGWQGHGWPAHSVAVDALVLVLAVGLALRVRPRLSLFVPAVGAVHWIVVADIVPTPHTALGWGSAALASGFALLLGALAGSYKLRRFTLPDA